MRILILTLLIFSSHTKAFELEGFAGANSTTFDNVSEANTYGISARAKLNFYSDNSGVFVNINARGQSLMRSGFVVGYAWRGAGDWFWEAGAGGSYSVIFGPGLGVLFGTGFRITPNLFINFPIIASIPSNIFWSPYIGYEF